MDLTARFPGISGFLASQGLELARDLIPVGPAAHYLMGGVRTDVHGSTSLKGLYAAGEAACTGVHGANRLASNSLLEGLVFGAKAAEAMVEVPEVGPSLVERAAEGAGSGSDGHVEGWIAELRTLMWRDAGLLRDGDGLRHAARELDRLAAAMPSGSARREVEARNLHAVAGTIVESALGREESRGAHSRLDFPEKTEVARHSRLTGRDLRFEAQG